MDWYRFLPRYWSQNKPTCRQWDAILNKALDEFGVTDVDRHHCRVGPLQVWIANWPYSYGTAYGADCPYTGLPTVATRKRLRREITKTLLAEVESWPSAGTMKRAN